MNPRSICLVASEVTPFAKTGGLADVAAALPRYLARAGHDVRIVMPFYRRIRQGPWAPQPVEGLAPWNLTLGSRTFTVRLLATDLPGPAGAGDDPAPPVYFVDCPELYDRDDIYTDTADEPLRFGLLARAAIESCQRMPWGPDVFHLNDWHTGLLPLYLRTMYAWDKLFAKTRTLLTIHNIAYQGMFGADVLEPLGLMGERRHFAQDDLSDGRINFLKTGLLYADAISTVSRTYAQEIQTPELGMGLDRVLQLRRAVLTGIVNGVDYGDWDPATDAYLPHPYTADDLTGKAKNKRALLEHFALTYEPRVPVLGIVSRLTGQKGFELLPDILPILLHQHQVQLVVLGSGESRLERYFQWLRDSYPHQVAVYRGYSDDLAHRIEAGADMFLMPSRFEPCGLNQMYSLRYGTIPIVRRTGGLADTVEAFDPARGTGTGFLFDAFESDPLYRAVREALQVWAQPEQWTRMMKNGMAKDFSWARQGPLYEALYAGLLGESVAGTRNG